MLGNMEYLRLFDPCNHSVVSTLLMRFHDDGGLIQNESPRPVCAQWPISVMRSGQEGRTLGRPRHRHRRLREFPNPINILGSPRVVDCHGS